MFVSAENLNEQLDGFTNVVGLCLKRGSNGAYQLEIELEAANSERIKFNCEDISQLEIKQFGGGLSQFMGLRAHDIRVRQLDRVNLLVTDMEDENITFCCSQARVSKVSTSSRPDPTS